MKILKTILILIILIACSEERQTIKEVKLEKPSIESNVIKDTIIKTDTFNIKKTIQTFLERMYQNDYSIINLHSDSNTNCNYIKPFPKEGIKEIYAFGNSKLKKYKSISYPQPDIFVFNYKNKSLADSSFKKLKTKVLKVTTHAYSGANDFLKTNPNFRFIEPKHGGYIIQYKNSILSLVKRCTGNNLKNINWQQYESTFLKDLNIKTDSIEVLWSRCGNLSFEIKKQHTTHR